MDDRDRSARPSSEHEEAIRQLVQERVDAVRAKDVGPLVARPVDDVVLFDALPPLMSRGRASLNGTTQSWFDGYASDIGYEVSDLEIRADDRLGFCSFAYHVSGTLQSGDEVDMWVRATLCCERVEGSWRIVHDHESVPFDPQTGQAVISLAP